MQTIGSYKVFEVQFLSKMHDGVSMCHLHFIHVYFPNIHEAIST